MKKHTSQILKLSITMMIFLSLLAVAMASPALTLNTVTWNSGTIVNISTKSTNDASLVNMSYITIRFSASNTANSSSVRVINITNSTATNFDLGYANFTFQSPIEIEDTSVGSVTGISTGVGAADAVSLSATTVTIDRTTPTAPSTLSPSGTSTTRDNTFTSVVVDGTTTGCTLIFDTTNPGSSSYVMTHSGTSCSVSLNGMPSSSYNYKIRATDGLNNADSSLVSLIVDGGQMSSAKKAAIIASSTGQSATPQGVSKGLSIINGDSSASSSTMKGELSTPELKKTGIGIAAGAGIGLGFGLIGGPLAFVTMPLGAVIGGIVGFLF